MLNFIFVGIDVIEEYNGWKYSRKKKSTENFDSKNNLINNWSILQCVAVLNWVDIYFG